VIDITDPTNPTELGYYDTGSWARDVAVSGGYAYVADRENGLRVIDITNPTNPIEVGYYDTGDWTEGVAVSGGYAYVVDRESGLRVVNITDPASPTEVGYYDTGDWAEGVAVSGVYAYVADGHDGLRVIDITDPTNPNEVGYYDTGDRARGVAVSSGYAYVVDGYDGLRVIDITDPTNPTEVGYYDTGDEAYSVAISGGYAYVADGKSGLRVIDITDPTNPTEVGYYDTGDWAYDVAVSGVYAYVADGDDGLYILDCTQATPVMLQAFSASTLSGEVRLTWEVTEETGIASYRLYRSSTEGERGTPYASIEATGRKNYEFVDRDVIAGEKYWYTLSVVDEDGTEKLLGTQEVTVPAPSTLYLGQNYPNPFNPSTEIEVRLPEAMDVELSVYDTGGRLVARLFSGEDGPGVRRYRWDGRDELGRAVPSGVYFYRLRAGKQVLSRKMVLVR